MYRRGKTAYLTITLSIDEYNKIKQLADDKKISKSAIVKSALRNLKVLSDDERDEIKKLLAELHRIGVNLNQIAKRLNYGDEIDFLELRGQLRELKKELQRTRQLCIDYLSL